MPSALGNKFMKVLIKSPLHALVGRNIAVITVTGCKTGRSIETPVNVVLVGESRMIISLRSRTWWRNLRGGCVSQLRISGKQVPFQSEVVETPAEVAASLKDYFTQYPGYAKYFNIKLGTDRSPDPQQLDRLAAERVVVKLVEVGN
jgi:hypothetical protein